MDFESKPVFRVADFIDRGFCDMQEVRKLSVESVAGFVIV